MLFSCLLRISPALEFLLIHDVLPAYHPLARILRRRICSPQKRVLSVLSFLVKSRTSQLSIMHHKKLLEATCCHESLCLAGAVFLLDLKVAGQTLLLTVRAQLRVAVRHNLAIGLAASTESARLLELSHVAGSLSDLSGVRGGDHCVILGNEQVVALRSEDHVGLSGQHHVVLSKGDEGGTV